MNEQEHALRAAGKDVEQLLSLLCRRDPKITPLHVAENILLFDHLEKWFTADCAIKPEDFKYQTSFGPEALRGEIATFLNRGFAPDPVLDAGEVSLFSGTRCALEVSARVIFEDQGGSRGVLMPAPYWQGFKWIYEDMLGGRIYPVPLLSKDDFALTLAEIRAAYDRCEPRPRALVLTNPNNPLGINYRSQLLEEIYHWALEETEMQVFSDEIYAHCQVEAIRRSAFKSALALPIARRHPRRVHVAWGFAKDFGLSGFRIGVLASRSQQMHEAVRTTPIAEFSPMTSSNSWFLDRLFAEPEPSKPADRLMAELVPRLKASFRIVNTALDRQSIPRFTATDAALFAWLDLRRWLDKVPLAADRRPVYSHLLDSQVADPREERLYEYLVAEARVSLLPGQTLSTPQPGFFRMCFTAVPRPEVVAAIDRIGAALRALG